MNTLDDIAKRLQDVQANQQLTMKMIRLILQELGLRKEIANLDAEMEASNGSLAPVSMDSEGHHQ